MLTNIMRGIVGALLAAAFLVAAGCGGVADTTASIKTTWAMTPESYAFAQSIDDATTNGYVTYPADKGYQWIEIRLSVHNLAKANASLDYITGTFTLLAANGDKYDSQLRVQTPVGQLPESYQPGQTQSGDVFFEVPTAFTASDVAASKVVFDYSPSITDAHAQTITIALKGVPAGK